MPYVNTAIIKAQKGFNAAALLKQGFHLQPFLDGKCLAFELSMEQSGKELYDYLLEFDKIQKLLVYQKNPLVVHADWNYPYDEQFIGYLYLKRPTWILPCHKLFFAPTWRHVADILNDCENNEKIAQEKIDKKMFSLLENKHPGGGWCMSALDEEEAWKIYAALKH